MPPLNVEFRFTFECLHKVALCIPVIFKATSPNGCIAIEMSRSFDAFCFMEIGDMLLN